MADLITILRTLNKRVKERRKHIDSSRGTREYLEDRLREEKRRSDNTLTITYIK